MDLQSLLDAVTGARDADAAARQQVVRDALAVGENLNLAELEQAAAAAFAELSEPGDAGYTDDAIERMGVIADVVDALRAEATAQETAARAAALTGRIGKPSIPALPAVEPAAQPDSVAEPPANDITEPVDDTVDPPPVVVEGEVEQQPQPALAAAAGRTLARAKNTVPLAPLPKQVPAHMQATFTLTAAADIPGYPMGSILDGIEGLTKAAMARMQALSRAGKNTTAGIAVLEREQPDEKLIATRPDDYEVISYACDERRLPGGNLVAAAGWCAPPEQIYDQFCPLPVVDGLVSLPTITARRGGITWPVTPDFSQIYTQTGFFMPIEEMNKGEIAPPADPTGRRDKPCYLVQCTNHQTVSLDVYGICVKVPILHERAYPELVNYVLQQIIAAHAHKMNAVALYEMEKLATTKVTLPAINLDPLVGNSYGPGATATLLGMIELQVEYLRYRHRLGMGATMEMVAPAFVKGILRSDLAKRSGVDMLTVTDGQLNAHMAARGVQVTYVLDWQDAFAGAPTGGPNRNPTDPPTPDPDPGGTWLPTWDGTRWGGATPPLHWPLDVTILIYPAGTYFKLTNDIISIDGLYDSSLLARNLHLAVFSEEGQKIALRGCYQPLAVTVPLCPSGETGRQKVVNCGLPTPNGPGGV